MVHLFAFRSIVASLWLLSPAFLYAQAGPSAAASPVPVEVVVPVAPIPVRADGKTNLLYELHLTNFSSGGLKLTGLEVRGNDPRPHPWPATGARPCSNACSC